MRVHLIDTGWAGDQAVRTFCAARDEDVDGLQELLAVGVALVSGSTWALDILDGRIQAIRPVISPGKPGHAGPVADARTVPREANRAPPADRRSRPAEPSRRACRLN